MQPPTHSPQGVVQACDTPCPGITSVSTATQKSLPEYCYSCLASTGEIVILKRGETGYYKTDIPVSGLETARELVQLYNDKLGVTRAQYEAMKAGSLFGWDTPAANPQNYDKDGAPRKPKKHERGDAR